MKLLLGLLFVGIANAAPITVDDSLLTEDQKSKLKLQETKEIVSTWAGIGKEVGEAVNSSLSAVTDQAERFGKTRVGTFTMALVAWRVVGTDLIGIIAGGIGAAIFTVLLIWYLRRCFYADRRIVEQTGWWIFGNRKYEYIKVEDNFNTEVGTIKVFAGIAIYGIMLVGCCIAAFAG